MSCFMLLRKLLQEIGHRMSPGHGPYTFEDRLDRFLCGLLRRKALPFKVAQLDTGPGVVKIPQGLIQPVLAPSHLGLRFGQRGAAAPPG
jgi:hypothetical protein